MFLFVKITESIFFKFDKYLKIGHISFAGFPTNQALWQAERGTDRDRKQPREGGGWWERNRLRENEKGRLGDMKGSVQGDKEGVKWEMHTEKQIFYIWSSDSSEGGRERKDKMKKNNSEDSEI